MAERLPADQAIRNAIDGAELLEDQAPMARPVPLITIRMIGKVVAVPKRTMVNGVLLESGVDAEGAVVADVADADGMAGAKGNHLDKTNDNCG